ncbi:MAG TPA: asparagine synthase (glutamine-hydrolyzing) [Chitinophagaceae bacterium]|nr:asparagine synthase (glutamine-hydrolyzing) [Chitinophagaceae bacterium]MCB9054662.1 asparagine synthase (glutamine-hydrolyzing) [Chitinophagales bacterium]HRX93924.1 asparagine synthase (glutamine-hydrolyzing) [Chitinophagaceae bacterium]
MCGIAGSINFPLNISVITKDLWHRGPDEQSTFSEGNLQLHHHRLSIVDIAGGQQPMHFQHLTLIFNGEIYNYRDLKQKFNLSNCQTNSDTEVLLHLYAAMGPACLEEMDGMYAMAIYDRRNNELFIARDRAGKKPFYYFTDEKKFVFASELNALRGQLDLSIDQQSIQQFIRLGYFYKTATAYKQVTELPAGSFAKVSLEKPVPQVTKWWNIHQYYKEKSSDSFDTALEKTDQFLHEAVKNRVEASDLEVGSFLSGGIDSGLVTAIAKKYNQSLRTFTVSFDGEYDEAPLAKQVADKYQTDHTEIKISFDNLLNDVEQILYNYGEPFFDSSAIPSYYVSQAAKKYLTVILNGDGGDELFGGYRRYVPFAKFDFFRSPFLLRKLASAAFTFLPVSHNKKSKYNYLYRLTDLVRKNKLGIYLSSTIDSFEGNEKYLLADHGYLDQIEQDFDDMNRSGLTGLQKLMNLDFDNILSGNLLVKMDIATMAHSLEGRSPLLCKNLLEYVPGLQDSFKIKGGQTKFLLRKLSEKYLPPDLIHQPKRGFEIPLKKWVDNELKDLIGDYIFSPNSLSTEFVDAGFTKKLWERKINTGEEKRAKMLWTLFALEVWYKKCYLKHA